MVYSCLIVLLDFVKQTICTVLLKALSPLCMEHTESQVANTARGKAKCYICHDTLTKFCIFHTNERQVL